MNRPLRRVDIQHRLASGGVRERLAWPLTSPRLSVLRGLLTVLLTVLLGALVALTGDAGRAEEPAPPAVAEQPEAAAEERDVAAEKTAAAAEPPAAPQPVGKLGIRKGTGRPAGVAVPRRVVRQQAVPQRNAPPPVAVGPAAVDGQQERAVEEHAKALQPQIEASLRSTLHAELYFIHLVCATDRQQRQQLARAAEALLPEVAAEAALQTARGQRRGNPAAMMLNAGLVLPEADQADLPQPLEMFRQRLVTLATEQLGPQRGERLQQELQQRVEAQRRAIIANVITQLDAFLVLTPQQQEDLVQPLLSGWQESWRTVPQYVQPQYMPQMQLPAAALRQLSDAQRQRWHDLPKIRFSHHRPAEVHDATRWQKVLEQLDRDEPGDTSEPATDQEPSK